MTTKVERTPGPWSIQPNGPVYNLVSPDRNHPFMYLVEMTDGLRGELLANARLIAASPALLEAARAALEALESPEARKVLAFIRQREALRAAIAAAEKEE